MNFSYLVSSAFIGTSILFVLPQNLSAQGLSQANQIAKQITVLVDSENGNGSGVIIQKQGNIYTILTAAHVVRKQDDYQIVTSDSQRYQLNQGSVKQLEGVDLAIAEFSSSKNYPVAKIGNSDSSEEGTTAFVAGFPQSTAAISRSIYTFTKGEITANAAQPLKDGYGLVYSNDTLPGMSGGAVLNQNGELIGIHGRADIRDTNIEVSAANPAIAIIKSGFNLGIPINTFIRQSVNVGVNLGISLPEKVASRLTADDFFIRGGKKSENKNYQAAIDDYTQAIKLNSNYEEAYLRRGYNYSLLNNYQKAIADYNTAIKINPNYEEAYIKRGNCYSNLRNVKGAIADYTQAIKINPKNPETYLIRGLAWSQLKDYQKAIADYNQVLQIEKNTRLAAITYGSRGIARFSSGNKQGGLADLKYSDYLFKQLKQTATD
ncbi:MAG: tetratricopeptide repeat-containing serine protease family protein [Cyanobacteria bacterium P01_C01_bin.38]